MQTSARLREFVQHQVSSAKDSEIDWDSQKRDWVDQVDKLYTKIKSFMKELTEEGLVSIIDDKTTLTEQYIGSYEISTMCMKIGHSTVLFKPIGTLIIAGRGRVDMEGPQGTVMFVLFGEGERPVIKISVRESSGPREEESEARPKPEAYEWVVAKVRGQRDYPLLNEDSFLEALKVVIGNVDSGPVE